MTADFGRFRQVVDDIKTRDLAEYIGREIKLEKSGHLYKCKSPFRADNDPSFFIYPDGRWHDFGTKESGDIINYVMNRNKCSFKDAVTSLAKEFNIDIYWEKEIPAQERDEIDEEIRRITERHAIFDILSEAVTYWSLHTPSKIKNEKLIKHYGLSEEIITRLKIGYAHGELEEYLTAKGYRREMLIKSGLFLESGDKSLVSFFKDRIVFPYWHRGQVVYAIGRQTEYTDTGNDWEKPKYKKMFVHNERHAKVSTHIRNDWFYNEDVCSKKLEYIIITEGVTDCIAAMQIDEPCISPVTIRFRRQDIPKLVSLLKQAGVHIAYLCNDADVLLDGRRPGEEGAIDTACELIRNGFDVRICELERPEGVTKVDLNEFLRAQADRAKEAFAEVRAKARPFMSFLLEKVPEGLEGEALERGLEPLFEALGGASEIVKEQFTTSVAKRFKVAKQTIRKYIAAKVPTVPKPKAEEPPKRKKETSDRVKGKVLEDVDHYYVIGRTGQIDIISNFTVLPKKKVLSDGLIYIVVDITTDKGEIMRDFVFMHNAWKSRRDFIGALKDPRLVWTGSDDEVQGLLRLINEKDLPVKLATQVLGYHNADGTPKWMWLGGAIYAEKFVSNEDSDVRYISNGTSVEKRYKYIDVPLEEVKTLAKTVLPKLLSVNSFDVVVPILGWFYATAFKTRILKLIGHFPILMVWGTHGSGKTSILREIFWPLMGVSEQTDPYSCTDSAFAITKKLEATNSCPILFDEHKPRDMGKNKSDLLCRLIRRVYGGETEEKGRIDMSVVSTALGAPWVIAGESPPSDPATLERLVQACPSRAYLHQSETAQKTFRELRDMPLAKLAASYVQFSLKIEDIKERFKDAQEWTDTFLKKISLQKPPPRIHDNMSCAIFGMLMFIEWAKELEVELPKLDMSDSIKAMVSESMEGASSSSGKDAFDEFLEQIHGLVYRDIIKENEIYVWLTSNGVNTICFNLESAYDVYLIERKKAGLDDNTGGLRAMRKILQEKIQQGSYVIRTDQRILTPRGKVRCVQIDPNKVPDSLSFSAFPMNAIRSYGGPRTMGE